jgi:lipoprotein-releasing system ATP-binding protein
MNSPLSPILSDLTPALGFSDSSGRSPDDSSGRSPDDSSGRSPDDSSGRSPDRADCCRPADCCGPADSCGRSPDRAAPVPGTELLQAVGLHKSYHKGPIEVPVLKGVDLAVYPGELLTIIGQSGSGKSTLLHLLGTLDAPDAGEILFDRQRIDRLAGARRDAIRNRQISMIFQFYHLLPELTTLENVLVPLMIGHSVWGFLGHRRRYRAAATELLELVGLGHRLRHRPSELSGGEMQRAAIARALIGHPRLLLADEPTGNLDKDTGEEILRILRTLNRQHNLTIVMVTHDPAIAAMADRVVRLVDGQVTH